MTIFTNKNPNNIDIIKNKLLSSPIRESKIILSGLEFKLKNYNQSYQLLKSINSTDKEKLQLSKDLIRINQFDLAETIINDIIHRNVRSLKQYR